MKNFGSSSLLCPRKVLNYIIREHLLKNRNFRKHTFSINTLRRYLKKYKTISVQELKFNLNLTITHSNQNFYVTAQKTMITILLMMML
jgi:hypothetical protein